MKRLLPSIARLLVAAYVGAVIAGPTPFGFIEFLRLPPHLPGWIQVMLLASALIVLPCLVAGLIAGRRLGVLAAVLSFVLSQHPMLASIIFALSEHRVAPNAGVPAQLLDFVLIPLILAGAVGFLGGFVGSRSKLGRRLDSWRGWQAAGGLVLALLLYSFTVGPRVAAHRLQTAFPGPIEANEVRVQRCGIYFGAETVDIGLMAYTDPSGLILIGHN